MQQNNESDCLTKFPRQTAFLKLGKRLTAIGLLWTVGFSVSSSAQAGLAQTANQPSVPLVAQAASNPTQFYQKAETELPEEFYVLYRIVDKIARANGLDERPWRVNVSPEYDINAFATDVNLVVVYAGMFDQLQGDKDAVACVVGHEMAHNAQRHIAVSAVQRTEIAQRLHEDAEKQATAEARDAQDDSTGSHVGGGILGALGGLVGGIIGGAASVAGGAVSNEGDRRIARANDRIEAIYQAELTKKQEEWAALNRKQEFEADTVGYQYMATAGFDSQGCLRVMDVLNSLPGSQFDGSHPATPARIEALKQLFAQQPAAALAAAGRSRLAASPQPLTYDISRDGASLRINSRHGNGNWKL